MLRRFTAVAVFLLIGALTTTLVSWTALVAGSPRMFATPPAAWAAGAPPGWPAPQQTTAGRAWGLHRVEQSAPVRWLRSPGAPGGTSATGYSNQATLQSTLVLSGWPWPAVRSRQWAIADPQGPAPDSVLAHRRISGWPVPWRFVPAGALGQPRLPIDPIWPGFALCSGVYALAAAAMWRTPRTVNRLYRRRCGLCPACGYPASAVPICAECGRKVRTWMRPPNPPAPVSRRERLVRCILVGAVAFAIALYIASGYGGLYFKGPGGWFVAGWNGHFAIGRASHSFDAIGVEAAWYQGPFRWGFDLRSDLVGRIVSVPLWAPLPLSLCLVLPHWWRSAVRRGLRRHWMVDPSQARVATGEAPSGPA